CFFFFQAEDGIRDFHVTGVQTCALPICFAITQFFYRADSYTGFVEAARAAGVTIPILAGILPTTEARRLRRVEELTGVAAPSGQIGRASCRERAYAAGERVSAPRDTRTV